MIIQRSFTIKTHFSEVTKWVTMGNYGVKQGEHGGLDRTVMEEPVIDMYIDGFDYEYKIKKINVQRKVRTPNLSESK